MNNNHGAVAWALYLGNTNKIGFNLRKILGMIVELKFFPCGQHEYICLGNAKN